MGSEREGDDAMAQVEETRWRRGARAKRCVADSAPVAQVILIRERA